MNICLPPIPLGSARYLSRAVLACGWLLPLAGAAEVNPPTIQLFPTSVVEEIKHTGNVAQEMEAGLQPVIRRLDEQQRLYQESKCEGAETDPGCERLARQLGDTYLEMLGVMSAKLPDMERAVNSTHAGLEKRLRRELGQKKTAWDLQEVLLGKTGAGGSAAGAQPSLRGRSGMRLSDRFRQYYRLVARPGSSGESSLAVIASDIYLDMHEASVLVARTREEINRATLMEELNQSFGIITPEMQAVVDGVKSVLFGETDLQPPVNAAPVRAAESGFLSPLQM
jgi:hypothetical protein